METNFDYKCNLVLFGDTGVGKSSLVGTYERGKYYDAPVRAIVVRFYY